MVGGIGQTRRSVVKIGRVIALSKTSSSPSLTAGTSAGLKCGPLYTGEVFQAQTASSRII